MCPEPLIKETWEEILAEVNEEDREADDYDEVRMFLENAVHDLMIIAVSVQFGGGIPTERRDVHINRIIQAVRNSREHIPHVPPGKCLVQLVEDEGVERDMECPICYEKIQHKQAAMLGCRHEFCRPCLEKHIEKNNLKCPMCRGVIQHITVRQTEDYVAICDFAARTSAPDNTDIYEDFEYNEYVV